MNTTVQQDTFLQFLLHST